MTSALPPDWSLHRPKGALQSIYDLIAAPVRMALLPDDRSELLHMTSLRAERLAVVLEAIRGRTLDIGAGDNSLIKLYRARSRRTEAECDAVESIGLDVIDWGGDCLLVPNTKSLPFDDDSFDTVTFVACLNHIPERGEALEEARRVLRPGGLLAITMINRFIGTIGHAIWWYSEDKHREVAEEEEMGLNRPEVMDLISEAGFQSIAVRNFLYGLNTLFTAKNPE